MSDAAALVDSALAALLTRVASGYSAWPKQLANARMFIVVDVAPEEIARTLRFDVDKPRLFAGIEAPARETDPYLALRLTIPQLYALLTSEEAAKGLVAEGNEPAILAAIAGTLRANR